MSSSPQPFPRRDTADIPTIAPSDATALSMFERPAGHLPTEIPSVAAAQAALSTAGGSAYTQALDPEDAAYFDINAAVRSIPPSAQARILRGVIDRYQLASKLPKVDAGVSTEELLPQITDAVSRLYAEHGRPLVHHLAAVVESLDRQSLGDPGTRAELAARVRTLLSILDEARYGEARAQVEALYDLYVKVNPHSPGPARVDFDESQRPVLEQVHADSQSGAWSTPEGLDRLGDAFAGLAANLSAYADTNNPAVTTVRVGLEHAAYWCHLLACIHAGRGPELTGHLELLAGTLPANFVAELVAYRAVAGVADRAWPETFAAEFTARAGEAGQSVVRQLARTLPAAELEYLAQQARLGEGPVEST